MVSACVGVASIVERRVTHRWTGMCSHQLGMSESNTRGYTTPPYMFFDPGYGPRSSRQTRSPPRAAVNAAADPAGPAPTTTTSKRARGWTSTCDECSRSSIVDHLGARDSEGESLRHRG